MNGKEKYQIKDVFIFFPSCCIFSYQYCTNLESDLEGFLDERGAPMWTADLNSVWEPVLASPVHSVTFLHISGCDHLCLFIFSFSFLHFVLQASAICTVLESEFRQDVQLRSLMNNDKWQNKKWVKKDSAKLRLWIFILHSCMRGSYCCCCAWVWVKAAQAAQSSLEEINMGQFTHKICRHLTLLSELWISHSCWGTSSQRRLVSLQTVPHWAP